MKKQISINRVISGIITVMLAFAAVATASITAPATAFAGDIIGEITVSCFDSEKYKDFLDYAAASFESLFPGVEVNIETFSAMPLVTPIYNADGVEIGRRIDNSIDPKAQSDYITRVNTEIMSGGGADIYAIDVLPYYKYADGGMFEDLRLFMDNDSDFDYDDYQKNIFDSTMYLGGQYILPLDYDFSLLSYNKTLMDPETIKELEFGKYTYDRLMELGFDSFISRFDPNVEDEQFVGLDNGLLVSPSNPDAGNQTKFINSYAGYNFGSLYGVLYDLNYNSFVDVENKTANFTDGRFAQILSTAKEFGNSGYIGARPDFASYQYKQITPGSLLNALSKDNIIDMGGVYLSPFSTSMDQTEDDEPIGVLAGDNGELAFNTAQAYAMNANSKSKDTAWAFLKFLLGDEMQGSLIAKWRYIPINKNAAAQMNRYNLYNLYFNAAIGESLFPVQTNGDASEENPERNFVVSSVFNFGDITLTEAQEEILKIYEDYIGRCSAMINTYHAHDVIIDDMTKAEIEKFFDGSRSADEVAEVLQNKVSMYLQE